MTAAPFVIHLPRLDASRRSAEFSYTLGEFDFVEAVQFDPDRPMTENGPDTLAPLANLAAAILGTSYFKLLAPLDIVCEASLPPAAIKLVEDVYSNGLGEFYARNELKRFDRLRFQIAEAPAAPTLPGADGPSLLLIGGGKDSLASAQILEALGEPFTPFAVNAKGPINTSVEALGRVPLLASRRIDPLLLQLNGTPGTYNGHVPSTAMNAIIAAMAARLFGFSKVVLSNERSANQGNRPFDGRMVNHQHSKSLAFERTLEDALTETAPDISTYSLLRPFSEARIAEIFARDTRFDRSFSSCNANFRLAGHDGDLWCCDCPKCRFVFLILAPHIPKSRLLAIFGKNLLDDAAQTDGFRELTGLIGQKPWECVGEIMEAAAALGRLALHQEWAGDFVVQALGAELRERYGSSLLETAWSDAMQPSPEHCMPAAMAAKVMNYAD